MRNRLNLLCALFWAFSLGVDLIRQGSPLWPAMAATFLLYYGIQVFKMMSVNDWAEAQAKKIIEENGDNNDNS